MYIYYCAMMKTILDIRIQPVDFSSLNLKSDLFQSGFWGYFKSYHEKDALAFVVRAGGTSFPLVLIQRCGPGGVIYAYSPRSPQIQLPEENQGPFLEILAWELKDYISRETAFIRFDTIWDSPYDDRDSYVEKQWDGPPRDSLREIRMNYFTRSKNLRKARTDMMPADTVVLDLEWDEEELFMDMRANTRNCIRRAVRRGVTVVNASLRYLPDWYNLYADTAQRKGFPCVGYEYFESLFFAADDYRAFANDERITPEFHLLLATRGKEILSGMIMGIYGNTAYYLFAGSSLHRGDHMPNYRLQWEAIRLARQEGCRCYDLFGIPPTQDVMHSQHGLFTFKTGFGGSIYHQRGCWDYPLKQDEYYYHCSMEGLMACS